MSEDWKNNLANIKTLLPSKFPLTAKRRRLTRKEVIAQKVWVYTRISDKIVRKRLKNITI